MAWISQHFILVAVLSAILLYVCTCLGYFVFHRFFVIFPSVKLSRLPSDLGLDYEEVFFRTSDNVNLQGWFLKARNENRKNNITILFFPGNDGTMSKFLEAMSRLVQAGFHVFLFGYRGFGKSDNKRPTEQGVYKDSEAAARYLAEERGVPLKNIVYFGQSLGCAMASHTALSYCPRAVILEGGFPSMAEVAARAVKWLPLNMLTTSRFETRMFLKDVRCPVLIVHSPEDKAIPLADASALFEAVTTQKKMITVCGPHAEGLQCDPDHYVEEVKSFLGECKTL